MTNRILDGDDGLTRWLESLTPTTAIFCQAEVRAPWGFRIEGRDTATFHILTEGEALLEVDGVEDTIPLSQGSLVLLPTGAGHALRDSPSSSRPALETAVASGEAEGKWFSFGGEGPRAVMVCGACSLGVPGARPPSDGLPIVLTHELEPALVGVVAREAEGLASGTEAVLKQLLTLVVLQALRAHLAELSPDELRALLSPEVARAVSYVHENLDEEIEVEDLCRETAMSRTVLTERFRDALGVSPIEYVRLARLSRAAEILQSSDWGLQRIARSVGYSSASTFSRAFQRRYGEPPGEYRTSE